MVCLPLVEILKNNPFVLSVLLFCLFQVALIWKSEAGEEKMFICTENTSTEIWLWCEHQCQACFICGTRSIVWMNSLQSSIACASNRRPWTRPLTHTLACWCSGMKLRPTCASKPSGQIMSQGHEPSSAVWNHKSRKWGISWAWIEKKGYNIMDAGHHRLK